MCKQSYYQQTRAIIIAYEKDSFLKEEPFSKDTMTYKTPSNQALGFLSIKEDPPN